MLQKSLLQKLSEVTTIVADTGDLDAIRHLKPVDATTNPSLITKALTKKEYKDTLQIQLKHNNYDIEKTIDDLSIQIGAQILELIPGRISTELNANYAYDQQKTEYTAKQYIERYEQLGINSTRVLIKIPATWQGIQAARKLEQDGIKCNLTLVFSMHQAQACADAGVSLISPFVGRILDWQKAKYKVASVDISEDMGVKSVKNIYNYYKQRKYKTKIMGASFRNTQQILSLAGCDLLTIAPNFLEDLANQYGNFSVQLHKNMQVEKLPTLQWTRENYLRHESESELTQALLPAGIQGFIKARDELAKCLTKLQ